MADSLTQWRQLAEANMGTADYAERYAANFDNLAATGQDTHGEAAFVAAHIRPGARVLDAGCGTGRVAARLTDLGYVVVGVDVDDRMIAVARARRPDVTWEVAALAEVGEHAPFDAIVVAGNVVPFVPQAELEPSMRRLCDVLAPGGVLVTGFGLDPDHLPPGGPILDLAAYDAACERAGLALAARYAGWDKEAWHGGGYCLSTHKRASLA